MPTSCLRPEHHQKDVLTNLKRQNPRAIIWPLLRLGKCALAGLSAGLFTAKSSPSGSALPNRPIRITQLGDPISSLKTLLFLRHRSAAAAMRIRLTSLKCWANRLSHSTYRSCNRVHSIWSSHSLACGELWRRHRAANTRTEKCKTC